MVRPRILTTISVVLSIIVAASAVQAQLPSGGADAPKASRLTMTKRHLKDMLAKWRANRPKLKACQTQARKKGLAGDDRWFFLSDCMKS
jgi:psiF repeat